MLNQKNGTVNRYMRRVFKWMIGRYSQTLVIAFINYWSFFYIVAFIREALPSNSGSYGMNFYFLQAFFYGWIWSNIILFFHCFILKYMLIHRRIKTTILFLSLHLGYFFCLVSIIIIVYEPFEILKALLR